MVRALWFVGGSAADVGARVRGWRDSGLMRNRSGDLQWAHFPHDTWQQDHQEALPMGGQPSTGFMGACRSISAITP